MNAPVFENRPCAMVLAVLAANLGAQKHDADSRLAHGRARSLVGTTGHANPMTCRDQTPPKSHKSRSVGEVGLERGRNRPETIYFLGMTLYCTRNRKGNFKVGMRTEKSRLRRSLMSLREL